jgi:hypothetical protein
MAIDPLRLFFARREKYTYDGVDAQLAGHRITRLVGT